MKSKLVLLSDLQIELQVNENTVRRAIRGAAKAYPKRFKIVKVKIPGSGYPRAAISAQDAGDIRMAIRIRKGGKL